MVRRRGGGGGGGREGAASEQQSGPGAGAETDVLLCLNSPCAQFVGVKMEGDVSQWEAEIGVFQFVFLASAVVKKKTEDVLLSLNEGLWKCAVSGRGTAGSLHRGRSPEPEGEAVGRRQGKGEKEGKSSFFFLFICGLRSTFGRRGDGERAGLQSRVSSVSLRACRRADTPERETQKAARCAERHGSLRLLCGHCILSARQREAELMGFRRTAAWRGAQCEHGAELSSLCWQRRPRYEPRGRPTTCDTARVLPISCQRRPRLSWTKVSAVRRFEEARYDERPGGSGPGLRRLPRWGTTGAEWEGRSGREEWAGAVSQPAAEPPDKRALRGSSALPTRSPPHAQARARLLIFVHSPAVRTCACTYICMDRWGLVSPLTEPGSDNGPNPVDARVNMQGLSSEMEVTLGGHNDPVSSAALFLGWAHWSDNGRWFSRKPRGSPPVWGLGVGGLEPGNQPRGVEQRRGWGSGGETPQDNIGVWRRGGSTAEEGGGQGSENRKRWSGQ
ncbi:hypothetical protein Q8A73_009555 [Channa argus]|nr:hypothetical protein Q8A73_009555 [Channa argus]